jgi:hypothetical protein
LQIHREKAVGEFRTFDFDAIRKDKRSRKLPRCNASIEKIPRLIVMLFAPHRQLLVFEGYLEILSLESGNRQRDAKQFARVVAPGYSFDVVGRIAVATFGRAVYEAFDFLKTQEKRVR